MEVVILKYEACVNHKLLLIEVQPPKKVVLKIKQKDVFRKVLIHPSKKEIGMSPPLSSSDEPERALRQ